MSKPDQESASERLARSFKRFAFYCQPSSPLYERFSLGVAADPELLQLAAYTRQGQPPPNMLFGAVQLLLLQGATHPLADFYPSIAGEVQATGDPYPVFRDFCRQYRDAIRPIIATRITQTNEVRRCAYLLPAFTFIARRSGGCPLALVEIGASAGLNLLWNRYGYDYGTGRIYGDHSSPVRITSVFKGPIYPPLPDSFPAVAARIGIDLNPIDVRDPNATLWLRALIWPEHTARATLLHQAIQVAQDHPPLLVTGSVFKRLPEVIAEIPPDATLCLYHTHVIYQFSPAERQQLLSLIASYGQYRDLYHISCEILGTDEARLELTAYTGGIFDTTLLALTEGHAHKIEWKVD
jgi:hypothetical protein